MKTFTYQEYKRIIPKRTGKFLDELLSYLSSSSSVTINDYLIRDWNDVVFYKALKAYQNGEEKQYNTLQALGFTNTNNISKQDADLNRLTSLFSKYYTAFTPYEEEERYINITPEDIIINIYYKYSPVDSTFRREKILNYRKDSILDGLRKVGDEEIVEINSNINKEFNKDFRISVINYLEMAGKIFIYLRANKANLKISDTSTDSLKVLSLLLALFYYNNVSIKKDSFNEQKILLEYLNNKGLTLETIEKTLGITIKKEKLDQIDPTLVLHRYFSDITLKNTRSNYTVSAIFGGFDGGEYCDPVITKKILGLFNLTLSDASSAQKQSDQARVETKKSTFEDIYKDLLPNVINHLKQIGQIYTYLLNKKDTLDINYVSTERDIYCLAVLLFSYTVPNDLSEFLNDNGVTIEKVLELFKLPNKEEFFKEVKEVKDIDNSITKTNFASLILEFANNGKDKERVNIESVIENIKNSKYTNSSIIQKIYNTLTNEYLDSDFTKQIQDYFYTKETERKKVRQEQILKDIPINTYNYLIILSSYYQVLKASSRLEQKDLEQLSIIFAAIRFDPEIKSYFDSMGISRRDLASLFGFSYDFNDQQFDIDLIDNQLRPYIFDRPNNEITVYSIFDNAFKEELTNSLNLRKALFHYGKKPEDFLGMENIIRTKHEQIDKERIQKRTEELFAKCDSNSKKIMKDAILIYDYVSTRSYNSQLITSKEDIEELSLLIALFLHDNEFTPFFIHNGVTLDVLLSSIGLNKKAINDLLFRPLKKELILVFEKYLTQDHITKKELIQNIFNDSINNSQILEKITLSVGSKYEDLQEEVSTQKEKAMTPEQGILSLQNTTIGDLATEDLSTIIDYGSILSKHSEQIGNSLRGLLASDSLNSSKTDISTALEEMSYEETIEPTVKQSLLERWFEGPIAKTKIKKYNFDNLNGFQEIINNQRKSLLLELKGYKLIKSYIEEYLIKTSEYVKSLKQYLASAPDLLVEDNPSADSSVDPEAMTIFTKREGQTSAIKILTKRIQILEMSLVLMQREYNIVNREIVNHFITISSLEMAEDVIIPLISIEMAVSLGKQSTEEARDTLSNLANLLVGVINENAEETKHSLDKLVQTGLPAEEYLVLSEKTSKYLETLVNRKNLLEEKPDSEDYKPKLTF